MKARKALKKERHLRYVKRKTIKAHKTLYHVRHVKKRKARRPPGTYST